MQGFAVIDHHVNDGDVAVWIVSKDTGPVASNSNAVVLKQSDPRSHVAVRSLTRSHSVLITDGSTVDGLPIETVALTVADLSQLQDEIVAVREQVLRLVRHLRRKPPTFASIPDARQLQPTGDCASQRALGAANRLNRLWTAWLDTDQQRRRYVEDARCAEAGILSPDLCNPDPMMLPPGFAGRVVAEPLV